MKVYASVRRYAAFHTSPGCSHLKGSLDLVELTVDEVGTRPPCLVCFPGFPKAQVLHALCEVCRHTKPTPCRHNGGVQVLVPVEGRADARRMVWPEQAYLYRLAPASIRV